MSLQPKNNNVKSQRGGLLVEIVVVVGIIVGALVAILGLATAFLVTSQIVQQTSQATALAQEGLEIVRNVRDGTIWTAVDGLGQVAFAPSLYHPEQSGSPPKWILVSGSETIGEFTRQIQFARVYRDGSANIVAAPGTLDSDTVKATAKVSWQERERSHEVELAAYFTNWNQ